MGFLIGLASVLLVLLVIVIFCHNTLVRLNNAAAQAWANVDVVLVQRVDEIARLVECVSGYMQYEQEVLFQVSEARAQYRSAESVSAKAAGSEALLLARQALSVSIENYPTLQSQENVLNLQRRITALEGQIADRREYYNYIVANYNTKVQSYPHRFIAQVLSFNPRELFSASVANKTT